MSDEDYEDLLGPPPDFSSAGAQELHQLAEPGAELSTGLILRWRADLVFAVDLRAQALGRRSLSGTVAFVGVGGHLEPGETWSQAAVREAMEEANCAVALGDSPITYLCRPEQYPEPLVFRWSESQRPLLVWIAGFTLRRGPQLQPTPVTIINAVFRAAALTRPSPGSEVATLLLLDDSALLHTYAAPRTLRELLARGAQIIGEDLPADTLLAPGGSAYFLAQWMDWQAKG